jgi:hypothetical protein
MDRVIEADVSAAASGIESRESRSGSPYATAPNANANRAAHSG